MHIRLSLLFLRGVRWPTWLKEVGKDLCSFSVLEVFTFSQW